MNYPTGYFDASEPKRGAWRTVCRVCEWEDILVVPYQDDCEITECGHCGSDSVEDINEEEG